MRLLAALLASLAVSSLASAQMQFHPAASIPVGDKPEGGAVIDIDGNGVPDLAVSTEQPDKIEFLVNAGNGTFTHGFTLLTGNATSPEGLAPGDFDGDGDVGLVAALFSAGQVQLILNQGNGTFALGATFAVQPEPGVVAAGDFNADGHLDAAVNNRVSGTVSVLLNNGAGGFANAVHYAVGAETRCVAAADVDGDGLADLAVSARDDRRVRLFKSQPGGTLTTLK